MAQCFRFLLSVIRENILVYTSKHSPKIPRIRELFDLLTTKRLKNSTVTTLRLGLRIATRDLAINKPWLYTNKFFEYY